jgi:protein-tyrosine phosphatase
MKKILFLCTGNYYRSRFAEHLFNCLALKHGLKWQAVSRGLALERGVNNIGAISQYTIEALKERGVSLPEGERLPLQVLEEDFQTVDLIIALDELEHQPLILERFPKWLNAVEDWLIHDIDKTSAKEALGKLEKHLLLLIEKLAQT